MELTAGKTMEISAGKLAHLANGSCVVRMGDTCVLAAVCSGPARKGADFFPLQVDYRENSPRPDASPADSSNAKAVPPTKKF